LVPAWLAARRRGDEARPTALVWGDGRRTPVGQASADVAAVEPEPVPMHDPRGRPRRHNDLSAAAARVLAETPGLSPRTVARFVVSDLAPTLPEDIRREQIGDWPDERAAVRHLVARFRQAVRAARRTAPR
jgi:hypothetical protein